MFQNKIPKRTIEERSLPESEHESLRAMATAYVDQHLSFRKQLRDRLVNDEASQLHEQVRKTTVLLRKLGNLRHEHYDTLVDLDQTIGRKQKLDIAVLILALSCVVTFTLAYFGLIPITTQELANNIALQTPLLFVWGGIIAFAFLHHYFHSARIMDLRDQLSWRMDDAASEIELINDCLSVGYADIWVWADLLYLHSCAVGDNRHIVGFIDRQARPKRLRTPFDISYYGFYPENTFMSFNRKDPRMPELNLLIECKLFIGLIAKHHWEVYWAVYEDWDSKGLQTPENTIQDYFAFQANYEAPPHAETSLLDNNVL